MQRVAVIGTGIAGLSAAHALRDDVELTLFEKNDYVGGHTNTVLVDEGDRQIPIDTGFMVFNRKTYPGLTGLFEELDVELEPTDMSFGVQQVTRRIEWAGGSFHALFAQRTNLLRPRFYKLLLSIQRFNRDAREYAAATEAATDRTLLELVEELEYDSDLLDLYLLPIAAAIWSTPLRDAARFPADTLIRFFHNHGLLSGVRGDLDWLTVTGGSRRYVEKLTHPFEEGIRVSTGVARIETRKFGVELTLQNGGQETFDHVIVAAHADQALRMLSDPTPLQQRLLSRFRYQKNRATLHTDPRPMPRRRAAWASWNYRIEQIGPRLEATTIYWMNRLQNVSPYRDYFVSINDPGLIDPGSVIREIDYAHPIFDLDAIQAQRELPEINQSTPDQRVFFCGSYFRHGFHEDAHQSGASAARSLLRRLERSRAA